MNKGKFYGVGIGPGCPDLVTVRGAKLIENADIIYVPTKNEVSNSVAYNTIKPYLKDAEIKPAVFSMSYSQDILDKYRNVVIKGPKEDIENNRDVVFVTLGDPMLYSTYVYILNGLKELIENFEYETVPGITSFSAMAAKSNTPLVEENEVLTIYPLTHYNNETFDNICKTSDAIVLMKIPKKSAEIMEHIKKQNFSKIVHMKNICLKDELINYHLNCEELNKNDIKKYLSIILLKK